LSRIVRIIAWLASGHAILGVLYWALLQVPESTVWALASSALLTILIVVTAALVESGAVLAWTRDHLLGTNRDTFGALRQVALRSIPALLAALVVFLAVWWLGEAARGWWTDRRGEIDAWLMMKARTPRTGIVHAIVLSALWVVRYPVALSFAVGVFAGMIEFRRPRDIARKIAAALDWRPVLGIALTLLIFVALPWRYVYWRPESLPANWMEPAFVAVKLLVTYALLNTGWAIVLSVAAREPRPPSQL
jgi:hypothetical protein